MKRFLISIPIVIAIVMLVNFLEDKTYAKYKKGINVNINDTTGKLVCDATLDNPGTYVSDDGWAYFKVIVKNYNTVDDNNVVTDVPVEYYLDITNANSSYALYRVTYNNTTGSFGSNISTTHTTFAPGVAQTHEYIVEVKTTSQSAEDVDFNVDLNCYQVSN